MDNWLQMTITIVCSVLASSGFWAYIQRVGDKNDSKTQMLMGLGHDRIVYLGTKYIERGYITHEEYENLYDYLYKPYEAMGGNGSARLVMENVKNLRIVPSSYLSAERGNVNAQQQDVRQA